MWIDQIITRNLGGRPSESNEQNTLRAGAEGAVQTNRTPITLKATGGSQAGRPSSSDPTGGTATPVPTPDATIPMKKPDIAAIALEMQKNRDIELAEIKEYQKPI
jgi:hypothetical protein